MKYRKKPVEIEAKQFTGQNYNEILAWLDEHETPGDFLADGTMLIDTLEGHMIAQPGDYIIRGVAGEFYPCKPHVFEKSYEAVK